MKNTKKYTQLSYCPLFLLGQHQLGQKLQKFMRGSSWGTPHGIFHTGCCTAGIGTNQIAFREGSWWLNMFCMLTIGLSSFECYLRKIKFYEIRYSEGISFFEFPVVWAKFLSSAGSISLEFTISSSSKYFSCFFFLWMIESSPKPSERRGWVKIRF